VQLVTDMLDVPCNVDGAVRASQRHTWHSIFPDPNLLLGIPAERLPQHVAKPEIAASRRAHIGGNLSISYGRDPLNIVRGAGQYLYDENAHRYIDGYNNVAHVGHAHPRVVRAVSQQMSLLNTNTRYLQAQLTTYAASLTALLPESLNVCYFMASGSEANELALRLARAHTGARDLIVMDSAYHGHTTTLIDISPYKHAGPGGHGAPDWVHASPIPDVYRTPGISGAPGPWFAARVGEVIDRVGDMGRRLSGYIAETCPSVAGQIMLPDGFLSDVFARVRAAGGVCIADEVQTGFGRIGTHFWAFEAHDVTPDIVVLGKPIANGYPMGAVITTRAIADSFDNGMEYFSTFGGSTAACVAGLTTLQVTLDERLQQHALNVGTHLLSGLRALMPAHELIGDVRGSGLFLGVELVRDRTTLEPADTEASFVVNRMRARGVLVGTDGPYHNVIKIRGPMPLTRADGDRIIETFAQGLREAESLR
jgi:4-aminobutyrate aminotransferase-like enzyme